MHSCYDCKLRFLIVVFHCRILGRRVNFLLAFKLLFLFTLLKRTFLKSRPLAAFWQNPVISSLVNIGVEKAVLKQIKRSILNDLIVPVQKAMSSMIQQS